MNCSYCGSADEKMMDISIEIDRHSFVPVCSNCGRTKAFDLQTMARELAALRAAAETDRAEIARLREAERWIPIGERLPEMKYGSDLMSASDYVVVAFRYPGATDYFRKSVRCWREYGWVYEWAGGEPQSFESYGYVVDFWHYLQPLPKPPEMPE